MNPHSLNFSSPTNFNSPTQSPKPSTSKRRVLGEIQNSPLFRPKVSPVIERLMSTPVERLSPLIDRSCSPVTSRVKSTTKISRIFEERSRFKMDKENIGLISETFVKLDVDEETRDCTFTERFQSTKTTWTSTKLDFTDAIPSKSHKTETEPKEDLYVPENDTELNSEDTLHDLEEEFDCDNFDQCTKYEIISTDSPNIISRGRSTGRKITSRNFTFGAPLADNEQSTSFNRPNATATRMLNFEDESFEFTSPAMKKSNSMSVKKSLKFTETPTKNPLTHERSDSSIGSMSSISSPAPKLIFTSESTTSMESGFISELEEPFLDIEESSSSPKVANFNELLSGQIRDNVLTDKDFMRRPLQRSLSLNPASKARVSLYSILENPEKRSQKRLERTETEDVVNKKRRTNPEVDRVKRPVLQRAFSENNASIMSALARSMEDEDLIGDFTAPFALPLTNGDHSDLKSISCDTLAGLLTGEFDHCISDFKIIDCRYPYEYEGGHILGAVNMHTPAQILTLINKPFQPRDKDSKRSILVFHCEFSIERGPKLCRFLRARDRAQLAALYPSLHHPELYVLHAGYRAFHRHYARLCAPPGYTAMLDPRHAHLLRKHRADAATLR